MDMNVTERITRHIAANISLYSAAEPKTHYHYTNRSPLLTVSDQMDLTRVLFITQSIPLDKTQRVESNQAAKLNEYALGILKQNERSYFVRIH